MVEHDDGTKNMMFKERGAAKGRLGRGKTVVLIHEEVLGGLPKAWDDGGSGCVCVHFSRTVYFFNRWP